MIYQTISYERDPEYPVLSAIGPSKDDGRYHIRLGGQMAAYVTRDEADALASAWSMVADQIGEREAEASMQASELELDASGFAS
jgi:hypothetical protein